MIKDLSKIILSDGKITSDERELMQTINQGLNKFVKAYIKALDDKIITQKENDQLKDYWLKIREEAEGTAMKDGIITPDERNMLIRICETILKD
jgi:tellurite resistance protein